MSVSEFSKGKGGIMPDFKKKKSGASGTYRPFENLKALLEGKSLPLADDSPAETVVVPHVSVDPDHPEYEQRLFVKAMAEVTPIPRGKYFEADFELPPDIFDDPGSIFNDDLIDPESLLRLKNLVEKGEGFVLSDTSEYIEGTGYCDNPELTDRLHRGDFSMQAYVDLHGLGAEAAQEVFDGFMKEAILTGKRAVLIVHGRGLSSPAKPVLKTKVQDWLTRGPWRKWIIAFSSARACDGGTGATYVLLRRQPFTKRFRKNYKKRGKRRSV